MSRARAVALLALGCALAAAASGTGPLLARHPVPEPFLTRVKAAERLRRGRMADPRPPSPTLAALDLLVQVVVGLALLAVVLVGLYRVLRLVRLRLARARGAVPTRAYDREDDGTDAPPAWQRRVRDELAALSAELDDGADAREVVIACYARMERALAAAGAPREAAESPLELLDRLVAEHAVPAEDAARLTRLFAEARFSPHPVTDEMRAAARRSLRVVAAALGAVPV
ncbi:MAG TPA: DUF4129 domain-containing protein [Mycobacteriales bacterium]|nr:DUF4129 domain-containing protein [Mycobacteriales bacterium]